MIEHMYQVLGYHRLLDILSYYASCTLGQSDCLSLKPSNDVRIIDFELKLVSEMRLLLKVKGFVSFTELTDISSILEQCRAEGARLEPKDFLCVLRLVEACQQSTRLVRSEKSLCPKMHDLVRNMPGLEALQKNVKTTISLDGAVKDSATPALKKVREKKTRLRLDLQKKLEGIQKSAGLSDERQGVLVTVRDGRYVIPLRADQKWRVKGIIHGYSQTRATCFFEPVDAIQDNNRMAELTQEETAEEHRILISLTGMVRDLATDLGYCQSLICRLDGLFARAKFSEALSCVMPEIGERRGIELRRARNPILLALSLDSRQNGGAQSPPVPVDILLDGNQNVLIISGPNRGGKTVTLKTLGLISLMAQAGMHIPVAEGSYLPVFDQIMAAIGDDQDIQTGLSTFSAHAAHLKYLIEHADQKSLAIIDEPGMGTDPDEGASLAMAVIDHLSHQDTYVAVSTHLNRLKTYGLLNQRAVNASVEFDTEKHCPTFELRYGSPGISHGLEMARKMGVPVSILARAEEYLDQDEVRLNKLIEKLNCLMQEANKEKEAAENVKRKYNAAKRKIKDRAISLETEKRALIEQKRIEAEAAIRKARAELNEAINLLKRKKESSQAYVTERYAEVSRRLLDYLGPKHDNAPSAECKEIEKGQSVYHKKLEQEGIVQSVDPSGLRALVLLGNVKVSAEIQDLEVVKGARESHSDAKTETVFWDLEGGLTKELNVIGYRIDEAIPLIDKTIDRALVDGELTLKIIHGFGTGRLRGAIRAHLKRLPYVKKIRSADLRFGGDAITIVELF